MSGFRKSGHIWVYAYGTEHMHGIAIAIYLFLAVSQPSNSQTKKVCRIFSPIWLLPPMHNCSKSVTRTLQFTFSFFSCISTFYNSSNQKGLPINSVQSDYCHLCKIAQNRSRATFAGCRRFGRYVGHINACVRSSVTFWGYVVLSLQFTSSVYSYASRLLPSSWGFLLVYPRSYRAECRIP